MLFLVVFANAIQPIIVWSLFKMKVDTKMYNKLVFHEIYLISMNEYCFDTRHASRINH